MRLYTEDLHLDGRIVRAVEAEKALQEALAASRRSRGLWPKTEERKFLMRAGTDTQGLSRARGKLNGLVPAVPEEAMDASSMQLTREACQKILARVLAEKEVTPHNERVMMREGDFRRTTEEGQPLIEWLQSQRNLERTAVNATYVGCDDLRTANHSFKTEVDNQREIKWRQNFAHIRERLNCGNYGFPLEDAIREALFPNPDDLKQHKIQAGGYLHEFHEQPMPPVHGGECYPPSFVLSRLIGRVHVISKPGIGEIGHRCTLDVKADEPLRITGRFPQVTLHHGQKSMSLTSTWTYLLSEEVALEVLLNDHLK